MTLKDLTATVEAMKPQLALLKTRTLELESDNKVLKERIVALEASSTELQSENKVLKEKAAMADRVRAAQEKKIEALDHKIDMVANTREQRERNPTLRVFNCKVSDSAKKSSIVLTNELYDTFLFRIFERAKEDGLIKKIPEPTEIIEYTHVLPSKKPAPRPAPYLPPGAPAPAPE